MSSPHIVKTSNGKDTLERTSPNDWNKNFIVNNALSGGDNASVLSGIFFP